MGSKASNLGVTWEFVADLARTLPDSEEGLSYGTPAFFRRRRLFVRLHQDGVSIVVNQGIDARSEWMAHDPESFFITDHYERYPYMLIRMATVGKSDLKILLEESWHMAGTPTLRPRSGRR